MTEPSPQPGPEQKPIEDLGNELIENPLKAIPQIIDLDAIRSDIVALAQAINIMNQYQSRIPAVHELVQKILAPAPNEARAQESLAQLKAIRQKLGPVESIIVDWDSKWHFITVVRFEGGYREDDGFDLRLGEPGRQALIDALNFFNLDLDQCDVSAPAPAGKVPSRRIVYPKAD